MITRQKKEEIVTELVEKFRGAQGLYLLDFKGMTVEEAIKLRREFKKADLVYKVAKNNLILRAIDQIGGIKFPDNMFVGETGIVFAYNDPVAPAKIIKEFIGKEEKPKLKGALLDGQFFDGSKLNELAALPGRAEMMSATVSYTHLTLPTIYSV